MTKSDAAKTVGSYPPMPEYAIADVAQRLRDAEMIEAQLEIFQEQVLLLESIITHATMPYAEYLKSEWWQSQRERVLGAYGHRCAVCDAQENLDVHHRTYANRGFEPLGDLIALCRDCHTLFHENGKLAPQP